MIIYLAGGDTTFFPKKYGSKKSLNCARLGSFFYKKDTENLIQKQGELKFPFFLDSGAFSAKSQNTEICINEYHDFIYDNLNNITSYANLDVIHNDKASFKNQVELESAGLKPVPVFHFLEDEKYLEKYLENHTHIALGGLVNANAQNWLDHIWKKHLIDSKGNAKVKVHGFGVTTHSLLVRYPWYSVDSTTWIFAAGMGEICFPLKRNNEYRYELPPIRVGTTEDSLNGNSLFKSFSKHQSKEILKYINDNGFPLGKSVRSKADKTYKLKENERWIKKGKLIEVIEERGISNDYMLRRYLNAIYFMKLQKYLTNNIPIFKPKSKLF